MLLSGRSLFRLTTSAKASVVKKADATGLCENLGADLGISGVR
jgi:hypothetical protein